MKKMIWILIMIILMITGCNKKDDEIDAQTQEKLDKFERIIADIKLSQKLNKREAGATIQDGIYIKAGERLNYYSVTALNGASIKDRVNIVVQIDKAPTEAKVVIENKLIAFNEYKDLETLATTGVEATTVISADTIVYDVGSKKEETAIGGENKVVGYWAKYNTAGDDLEQVLFLTDDCKIEYQKYGEDYYSTRGTYVTTASKIISTLEYNTIDKEISYTITTEGKLKVTVNGNVIEFTKVIDSSKIVAVKGNLKYKNGTNVKGKIIISTGPGLISKETVIGVNGNYSFPDIVFPIKWFGYRIKILNEAGKCIYEGMVDKADESNNGIEITGDITNYIVLPVSTEESAPAQENVTLIKEITDVSNDELYSYPTAVWNDKTVFPQGMLDIKALRVYSGAKTYEFEIEMGTDITQLWTEADDKEKMDRMLLDIYVSGDTTGANITALYGRNMIINNGYDKVITIAPYKRDIMKACVIQNNMVLPFIRSITGNKIRVVVSKSALGIESIQNIQMLSMACDDVEYSGGTLVRMGGTNATQWGFGGYTGGTNAFDMLGTNNKTATDMISVNEVSVIGTWAKYSADNSDLEQALFLTVDGKIEYYNYKGTYFGDFGTYTYTPEKINSTLIYSVIDKELAYTITDDGKLKITVKGTEIEFSKVGSDKKSDVTGAITYSDGTAVKGKILFVSGGEEISKEEVIGSDGSYSFEDVVFPFYWFTYRIKVLDEAGKCIYLGTVNRADETANWAEITGDVTNNIIIPVTTEETAPAQETVSLVKEITDAGGDELYSYPTAAWNGVKVFNDGLFDIKSLKVYEGTATYEFEIEMAGDMTPIWKTDIIKNGKIERNIFDIYVSGDSAGTDKEAIGGRGIAIGGGYDKVIMITPYSGDLVAMKNLGENIITPFIRSADKNKIRVVVSKSKLGLTNIKRVQMLSMACDDFEYSWSLVRSGAEISSQWGFGGYTEGTNAFDMLGTNSKIKVNMNSIE